MEIKCITYGYVIVFMLILGVIVSLVGLNNPNLASTVWVLGFVGLHTWWLSGWFSDCPNDYYGDLQKIPRSK